MSDIKSPNVVASAATVLVSSTVLDINADFGFTADELNAADIATIATDQPLAIMYDGVTVPSATQGIFVGIGGGIAVSPGNNVRRLTMVRTTASDCNVTVILEGY